jgi:hypothetical protein
MRRLLEEAGREVLQVAHVREVDASIRGADDAGQIVV